VVCHNIKPDKPEYLGGKEMVIKAIADRATGRLLGAQIVGPEGVDKRIDVFAPRSALAQRLRICSTSIWRMRRRLRPRKTRYCTPA
jgi:hypothetical protein